MSTSNQINGWFNSIDDEEFANIPVAERLHPIPKLCGLLYLDKKCGLPVEFLHKDYDDRVFVEVKSLNHFTRVDAIYLSRCGFHWDDEQEMFGTSIES